MASVQELAATNIKKAQEQYKWQHDHHATLVDYNVSDLVSVRFPHEKSGMKQKLSRPWHGPYRVVQHDDPDLTVTKQFFPEESTIQIHQLRMCPCPQLPIGFYWYGGNSHSTVNISEWVEKLTQHGVPGGQCSSDEQVESGKDQEVQDD